MLRYPPWGPRGTYDNDHISAGRDPKQFSKGSGTSVEIIISAPY